MTSNVNTTINFNGDELAVESGINISQFLQQQEIIEGRFVVVINDEIVPKSEYGSAVISAGDALEIMSPITGG
ncbi:thiamine biosynthesis protein ThiS [Methylophaga sp. 42_25_T18]|nr:thiamine biosynthesis protein ThiS [Methylophaga sp. 42_25_T18]OUR88432.1 thiamine biosynthesis protein ThiS [Methylophaga sp. 42_8_T64]